MSVSTVFARFDVSPIVVYPATAQGSWAHNTGAVGFGNGGTSGFTAATGTAQQTVVVAAGSAATGSTGLIAHAFGPLEGSGTFSGNWTLGFALAASNGTWNGAAAVFIMTAAGALRGMIFDVTNIGSTGRTTHSAETTCLGTVAGATVNYQDGDYILVEYGIVMTGTVGSQTFYCTGTTQPVSDNVTATSCASFATFPVAVTQYPVSASFWMRLGVVGSSTLPNSVMPAGYLTTGLSGSNSGYAGANAKALSTTPGSSQLSTPGIAMANGSSYGIAQMVLGPLAQQTMQPVFTGSAWGYAITSTISNTALLKTILYLVDGTTGLSKATVQVLTNGSNVIGTAETTTIGSIGALSGTTLAIAANDYFVLEIIHTGSGGSPTQAMFADGTTVIATNNVATSSAKSYYNFSAANLIAFIPPITYGTGSPGAGAGMSAAGVAQPAPVSGTGNLGAGAGLAAGGTLAVLSVSGASSFGSGAGLAAGSVATPTKISGASSFGSGAGLAAAGVPSALLVSGSATLGSGAGLAAAGVSSPTKISGSSSFGSGAGLAAAGVTHIVSVSGSASFGSGAGLSGVGTFQSGTTSGTSTFGSGAGLSAAGVPQSTSASSLSGGAGLFAVGLPKPAITAAGTSTLGSGAGLSAVGVAGAAPISGTSTFGSGAGLSAQGTLKPSAVSAVANLGSGAGLLGAGAAGSPKVQGTATLGAGAGLAAQGVVQVVHVSAVSVFGVGSGLSGAGVRQPGTEVQPANFGSGAGLSAQGTPRPLAVSGAATFGSGVGLAAAGAGAKRGAATFGAGAGLSAIGVVTTKPSPVIVTASATLVGIVSASVIIEGIVTASILPGELEVESDPTW